MIQNTNKFMFITNKYENHKRIDASTYQIGWTER